MTFLSDLCARKRLVCADWNNGCKLRRNFALRKPAIKLLIHLMLIRDISSYSLLHRLDDVLYRMCQSERVIDSLIQQIMTVFCASNEFDRVYTIWNMCCVIVFHIVSKMSSFVFLSLCPVCK